MGFVLGSLVGIWLGGACYLYAEGRLLGDSRPVALRYALAWPIRLISHRSL